MPLMSVRALLTLGAVLAVASPARAQNFDAVEITTTPLSGGVYMLQGSGGNIGLAVGEDAVFLVDDQYAPLTPKILAAIRAVTPRPVRFVLNTHWHFDHTGGNENMAGEGALVIAHENVRRRMASGGLIEALDRTEPAAPQAALPVVTFTEGVSFHLNGDSVVVAHVPPGHTDGDAVVHFTRANVVHMGDLFVSAGLPFVDLSSGGSVEGIIGAADKVLAIANAQTRIIPGHGPLADRARLQAFRDMVVALRERMRAEVRAGRTVEEVLAMNITAAYAQEWPGGHERFVRLLHQELSR
jgi:glyoxylase-like metal-dependent hydrolase (beta-lactamase superfamily II)